MRVAFRITKYNRYSFVPLISFLKGKYEDLHIDLVDFADLQASSYDLVFYSFMSPDVLKVKEELPFIRTNSKVLIAGGCHPTARPYDVLNMGFDVVIIGEGELSILKLIEDFKNGRLKRIYKSFSSFLDYTLKSCPYTAPIEIVRGCVHQCMFCQVPRLFKGIKYRSVASVIREAKILVERGRKFVRFIAPNALSYMSSDGINPNVPVLERLFKELKDCGVEEIYFGSFPSEVRPESVTVEVVDLMRRFCNNRRVVVGAQSGSNERLAMLKRGHSVEDVIKAVEILNDFGFKVVLDFIFGFPGESHEEQKQTLDFICYMLDRYSVFIHAHTFIPLPGTPLGNLEPTPIPKWLRVKIHELEREGVLDGYWQRQEKMRSELWREMVS